jgi:glycerol-3-phosphate acyltransferase PlsY
MAELADAADLKSAGATLVGSSPTPGTTLGLDMNWIVIVLGYLLGSIPTAYIIGHISKGTDIRQIGDENVGAANAYRQLSRKAGALIFIIDAGKGALAVHVAQIANMPQSTVLITGLAAVIGHNWPVFLHFRGGRGVSTTLGILLVLVTQPMLILVLPTIIILIIKRNVTPAMAFLFLLLPLIDWWLKVSPWLIIYGAALPALVAITTFLRTRPKVAHQA